MGDIRKERLVIAIVTVSALGCILQSIIDKWEFWVPPLIIIGLVLIWMRHLSMEGDQKRRYNAYYLFTGVLIFYYGIHEVGYFDISLYTILFMTIFSLADRVVLLNIILIEYAALMVMQYVFHVRLDGVTMKTATITGSILYITTVISMYIFCRLTISYRITADEKLEKWQGAMEENNHDMEDFLSNISHELRTPVNVISGMTAILQKDQDSKEFSSVQQACQKLSNQIEDIQDYTEIKRGELMLSEENYVAVSLINDVVMVMKSKENKKDLELVIDLDPQTPAVLSGDIKKLHKLFRHLLENSLKFTTKGGIYIRVYTMSQPYGVNLIIQVTDTGVGMTRADIARVTKGMYQANKKRNRSTGGIGIGLPIVYGFVHQMGGFVKISSKKGRGTTVRLTIPQKVVNAEPCLALSKDNDAKDLVFFIQPEKYKVPQLRDFYRNMAVNLASGLKRRLYSATDEKELESLLSDLEVTHIFTGVEEYQKEKAYLDSLAAKGIKVAVSSDAPNLSLGAGVMEMPKPLYAFPVVRILNGEDIGDADKQEKLVLKGISALVVDDEPMNLVVASSLFKEYQMIVDTADSGKEAIEKVKQAQYDVVFMDHMMPGMDGVEAMQHIRFACDELGRKNPIMIALTANALSGSKEMFANVGFEGFIAKPIDIVEFERVMRKVLPDESNTEEGRNAS